MQQVVSATYFPPSGEDSSWESVTAADVGWDPTALDEAVQGWIDLGARQVLLLHRGRRLVEAYGHGAHAATQFDIASMQKSITSLLVGRLCGEGLLSLDAPLSDALGTGWTHAQPEEERTILLRHVLSMTSGLYDDFEPETRPGDSWYYNNNAYHQVRKAIEAVTGKTTQEVSAEILFEPLGMRASEWRQRPGMVDPHGWTLSGLHTTARDMGRFGLAVLSGGRWNGRDLIANPGYLEAALAPSQDLNPAYGLLWWRLSAERGIVPGPPRDGTSNPRKSFGGIAVSRPLALAAPPDTVSAMGFGDMRLYVVPSLDLVAVRHGVPAGEKTAAGGSVDQKLWTLLAPAMPAPFRKAAE